MLLTSSQVSIAASSSVVVVFTTALFLSGYAIQQRTLRDLREAIKPSPRAKAQIFLPDRFRSTTTELQDGTVVIVDVDPGPDAYRPPRGPDNREQEQVVVQITPTVAGDNGERQQQEKERQGESGGGLEEAVEVLMEGEGKDETMQPDSGGGTEEEAVVEQTKEKEGRPKKQKKLGRAERRRLIKEEIQRLAQGNRRGVYQPRLW